MIPFIRLHTLLALIFICQLGFLSLSHAEPGEYSTVKGEVWQQLSKRAKKYSVEPVKLAHPPIQLECFTLKDQDLYMGFKQVMEMSASIKRIESVISDFESYPDIFLDLAETKVTSKSANLSKVYWEQSIPLPLVPNIKYEMIYGFETPAHKQRLIHYHLHESGKIKFSDGFILLKELSESKTLYIEYDFFDAEWGPAKILGQNRLWKDALEGLVHSDLAIKLKAENAEWKSEQIRRAASQWVETPELHDYMAECIKDKTLFNLNAL
jgi:hypothetical protein